MIGPINIKNAPDLIVKNPFPVVYLNLSCILLEECMSMKGRTDTFDQHLVHPTDPFIKRMIAELSGTDCKKSSDSS